MKIKQKGRKNLDFIRNTARAILRKRECFATEYRII